MSVRFITEKTPLDGVVHLTRNPIGDARGYLERLFCADDVPAWGSRPIAQINRTRTLKAGTLRGLHFQHPPNAECKYITCLSGRVYDVALDLRFGSKTYGQWYAVELVAEAHNALIIPEGFAHGFQTMSDNVEMLYLHSAPYAGAAEGGIDAIDVALNIRWPAPLSERSKRDAALPCLQDFEGITL
ncbi:dTDP-4-dehydrorhamnose 3,5-epimerase family protein [Parasphingorhabdus sp.]|jgi:dTDP-4-dehydrorhamnose 3,5-epimerase|uniref:dTDP-4-dehydrorhamnose 3,5-epimerase family protein n=1 Tax=Parasphingorhabdus sp. TaxID=2709688 RepID=UPI0032EF7AF9